MRTVLLLVVCCAGLTGCGAMGPDCTSLVTTYAVSPVTATADHLATAPGNQQLFSIAATPTAPAGCPAPTYTVKLNGTWMSGDPANVTISSANDATNGLATCVGTTAGPVALTASFATAQRVNATLVCK